LFSLRSLRLGFVHRELMQFVLKTLACEASAFVCSGSKDHYSMGSKLLHRPSHEGLDRPSAATAFEYRCSVRAACGSGFFLCHAHLHCRLETHYQAEYGLPSTHALNACCMPWFMVWSSYGRIDDEWMPYLCAFAATWTTLTTLSRLYMGVHTPADLVTGCILGFMILAGGIMLADWMDYFLLLSPWSPLAVLLGLPAALYVYPRAPQWTNSLGDTTVVTSASLGVVLTSWLQADAHVAACAARIEPISGYQFLANMPAYLLGCVIIIGSRSVAKAIMLPLWRLVVSSSLYQALLATPELSTAQGLGKTPLITAKQPVELTSNKPMLSTSAEDELGPAIHAVPSNGSLLDPSSPTSDGDEQTPKAASPARSPLHRRAAAKRSTQATGVEGRAAPQLHMADEGEKDEDSIALQHRTSPGAQYGFRYDVEVPVKMVVYCFIGMNVNLTSLLLLQWLGVKDFHLQTPW